MTIRIVLTMMQVQNWNLLLVHKKNSARFQLELITNTYVIRWFLVLDLRYFETFCNVPTLKIWRHIWMYPRMKTYQSRGIVWWFCREVPTSFYVAMNSKICQDTKWSRYFLTKTSYLILWGLDFRGHSITTWTRWGGPKMSVFLSTLRI